MRPVVTVVAPVPSLSRRTRLAKFSELYQDNGFSVDHWAWVRADGEEADDTDDDPRVRRKVLLRGGGYASNRLAGRYLVWMFTVLVRALRRPPEIVHALGFESALPIALARILRPSIVLCFDDADRFSLCHSFPSHTDQPLRALERWVARQSILHLVPGAGRYPDGLDEARAVVVRNFPSATALHEAKSAPPPAPHPTVLTVYLNGLLAPARGSAMLLECAGLLATHPVEFLMAGRMVGEAAEAMSQMPNVSYRGVVGNVEALRLYFEADVVVTLYDPSIPINQWAEANKWGDCVSTNTPFIVNKEVITAREYVVRGAAIATPYGDAERLANVLAGLARDRSLLHLSCAVLQQIDDNKMLFDIAVKTRVLPVLSSLIGANSEA